MEIVVENVSKSIKIKKNFIKSEKIEIVKELNLVIRQGEIIALVGRPDSGKTTIINLLSGKTKPTSGNILVDGVVDDKRLRKESLVISDYFDYRLANNESVYNNLMIYGSKLRISSLDVEKRINEFKEVVGIDRVFSKKVASLDGLEKIKVNIAMMMLRNPEVIFLDDVFGNISLVEKNIVLKIFKRINKEFKTSIVVASSDIMDVEKICKRVCVVQDGSIVIDGDFEEIKEKYWQEKEIRIIFNKSYSIPKGDIEIVESSEYYLRIIINFNKCDFASFIKQFDINTIVDIYISSVPISVY